MSVLIFFIVLYILLGLSMMKLFEKAGIPGWKALVPGLAAVEWCKMIGRKPQYALWLLFPIVNIFIYAGMVIDMVRSFGKHSFWQAVMAVVYAPVPFFMIGLNKEDTYQGPILEKERVFHRLHHEAVEKKDKLALKKLETEYAFMHKSQTARMDGSHHFCGVCRRVYPDVSHRSLRHSDFFDGRHAESGRLSVCQQSALRHPDAHDGDAVSADTQPFAAGGPNPISEKPSLPYYRLPAIETVDRNEPVVFNWPVGDSVVILPDALLGRLPVAPANRRRSLPPGTQSLPARWTKKTTTSNAAWPLPGDSIQIRDGNLYINGEAAQTRRTGSFSTT